MLTKVTSKDFEGLTNPYTGEPMVVFMNVDGSSRVTFTCPDTYSTAAPAETTEKLYDLWNRINGVSGFKTNQPIKCAYTGELLSPSTSFGKPCYAGGFDPRRFYTREEFLYYAWMRDGVSKFPPPEEVSRIKSTTREGEITERHKEHADQSAPSLDEEKIHMIEDSMAPFKDQLEGSSTVSMAVNKKGNRRGK